MTNSKNKPVHHLNFGPLEAAIWRNVTKAGAVFYTVSFTRKFRDAEGKLKATASFRRSELLALASLATTVATDLTALELRTKNIGPDAVSTEPTPVVTPSPKAA